MGRITDSTIAALYSFGKKVYNNEISLEQAAAVVNQEHPEVALSSAKHYIRWYSSMRNGSFLTWNSNSSLLIYYVNHIYEEEGENAGKMACDSAIKFAEHVHREELIEKLKDIAAKNEVNSVKNIQHPVEKEEGDNSMRYIDIIGQIKDYIKEKGFTYPDELIENFFLSLKAKPFVILAGTSGTGKTRLVRLFAEAVGATHTNGRYKQVAVRPDWSDSSELFGHVDLNGQFVNGEITNFIEQASEHEDMPYFLCLDEMNLARVEYYMSDILSVMETRDIKNGRIETDSISVEGYGNISFPENLYIIGTVNMDETTFPFSKKVLDRANTIEFSFVDLLPHFDENDIPSKNVKSLELKNSFFKAEYLFLNQCTKDYREFVTQCCQRLEDMNNILKEANAQVGYRVRDEVTFYMLYDKKMNLIPLRDAMDNEILQKILPRIQGSSSSVRDMICKLFIYCAADYKGYQTGSGEIYKKMNAVLSDDKRVARYPRSAAKLSYMMRRYEEDGFTSYWL